MLKSLIAGKDTAKNLQEILKEFHLDGPISPLSLEKLSYIKKYHQKEFSNCEKRVVSLMGLFYKTSPPKSVLEEVYSLYASSIQDETGHRFSPVQASAYRAIKGKKYFSFSAPTSSGKSFLFRALIEETKGDIVIVVPSRALISEYFYKVLEIVNSSVLVLQFIDNVNTSKIDRRVFIITPERGVELFKRVGDFSVDLFLLDEAHISEDLTRGMKFDSFVRRVNKAFPKAKKVFAHPFVNNPEAQLKKHSLNKDSASKNYQQNAVGKIFLSQKSSKFKYFSPNVDCENVLLAYDPVREILQKNGTLLVYISKQKIYDGKHLTDFGPYVDMCPKITNLDALALIEKLRTFIGADSGDSDKRSLMIEMMKKGIVIHHGSIPLKARLIIEEFVRSDFARICFATSTLNQGINMPFDIVWIDNFKGLDSLTLKNLIGRAGRTTNAIDVFDFGYTIVKDKNVATFSARFKEVFNISEKSSLDNDLKEISEDMKDTVEALRNDSFDDELHLPKSQVDRLSDGKLDGDIEYILGNLLENGKPLTGNKYTALDKNKKESIKSALRNIYVQHLRRTDLVPAESTILSTAIPIMLWHIQGRSFSEVVSLRHAYLSSKDDQRKIISALKKNEITATEAKKQISAIQIRFNQGPSPIPDNTLRKFSSFPASSVDDLDYDQVVYDTYDYLDKVISLSMTDPVCAAFELYYRRKKDPHVKSFINYVRYGTDNETEIFLIRYGFGFEEIEWIKEHIDKIDSSGISFKNSIKDLSKEQTKIIERYL